MKSTTRFTLWLALNSTFAASAYFGYVEGNENARNVIQFLVFFVTLPVGLIVLTDAYIKKASESKDDGPNKFLMAISRAVGLFVLGCIVWGGGFIVAAVWVFWMFAKAVSNDGVKKLKESADKSS